MGPISKLREYWSRRTVIERPAVAVVASGFTVGATAVAWDAVTEIWGYKVDLITTDEAFLEFSFDGQAISVSEEMPGFDQLDSAMAARFPTTADWRSAVLLPAFDPCRTPLYRRA